MSKMARRTLLQSTTSLIASGVLAASGIADGGAVLAQTMVRISLAHALRRNPLGWRGSGHAGIRLTPILIGVLCRRRPAGLGNLTGSLIARAATTGLRIGAAGRACHTGAARIASSSFSIASRQ
jgi:hypothetical protein